MVIRLIILFLIIVLFLTPFQILACVGARPLGMGGGFIAIADDENAVYWNPAGLSKLKGSKLASTFTLTGKDQMSYRNFISYVKPNMGFSYISRLRPWNDLEEWYTLSLSQTLNSKLSVGVNFRYEIHSASEDESHTDLGMVYSPNSFLNLGFLYQSLNNFRPGVSFDFGTFKIGFDVYNALHNSYILGGEHRYLFGAEWKLNNLLTFRVGSYANDLTLGISRKFADFSLSLAMLMRKTDILLLTIELPQGQNNKCKNMP